MEQLEGPTTQRPLNLDDDSDSESGMQETSRGTDLVPGIATGVFDAGHPAEPEEDSGYPLGHTHPLSPSDDCSWQESDDVGLHDPSMADKYCSVESERHSHCPPARPSSLPDIITAQDFEDLDACPADPDTFVSRTFLLNTTHELKRSLRGLDQQMARLEEVLHTLHEDVADSLQNSRSLLSRTKEEVLEQRNAIQQERQLYTIGLQEMEVKLTKVELAISTLKVQHTSDTAHIQHLVTNFEEWQPLFEDIGMRLGRMEEVDDATRCLARDAEEKIHELAAGQLDLNTHLDDALGSILPSHPLALELRHALREEGSPEEDASQPDAVAPQETTPESNVPFSRSASSSWLTAIAEIAAESSKLLSSETPLLFATLLSLVLLGILVVCFIWPSVSITTENLDHPFWRSVRS